jgi:hypothetical protein
MRTQNKSEERELFTTAYSENQNRIDHLEDKGIFLEDNIETSSKEVHVD